MRWVYFNQDSETPLVARKHDWCIADEAVEIGVWSSRLWAPHDSWHDGSDDGLARLIVFYPRV